MALPDLKKPKIWVIKKWKHIGGIAAFIVSAIAFFANIEGAMSFGKDVFNITDKQDAAVSKSLEDINTKMGEQGDRFAEGLEKVKPQISCKNLSDDWVVEDSFEVDNQYLLLKNGVQAGSIRFFKTFSDTFVLKFTFIPDAIDGANAIFSIKDTSQNEFIISLADDTSDEDKDTDLDYYGIELKKPDGSTTNLNNTGSSQILPVVKSGAEVILQIQTLQRAKDLLANAHIIFTPAQKTSQNVTFDLGSTELPYFSEREITLNMGLNRIKEENKPGIKVIDCEIQEISY